MAEIPGIEKKDIDLKLGDNTLILKVETPTKKYYREVELPTPGKRDC